MSRPTLVKKIKIKNPKLNNSEIETIIDIFCINIQKALRINKNVQLREFGTFFVKKIKEKYSARNPKTGELIYVPKKNKIRFRTSKKFKELLNK